MPIVLILFGSSMNPTRTNQLNQVGIDCFHREDSIKENISRVHNPLNVCNKGMTTTRCNLVICKLLDYGIFRMKVRMGHEISTQQRNDWNHDRLFQDSRQ